MRKWIVAAALLLLLTGCGKQVDLMPGVSPENSALSLYVYDGETVTQQFLFETEEIRARSMADFQKAKAKPAQVDLTTLTAPFYGMEMYGSDGWPVYGLWSDGYFLTGNGAVYEFDYDFEAFRQKYAFQPPEELQMLTYMPCASFVAKSETGWNKAFLTETAEPAAPAGVTAELIGQTEDAITVRFTNDSGTEWGYGYAYAVQAMVDGVWYDIPAEENMAFIEILLMVPQGRAAEESFSLEPYGTLPAGTYRVASNGLTAVFAIE